MYSSFVGGCYVLETSRSVEFYSYVFRYLVSILSVGFTWVVVWGFGFKF